jgi:hypothetical protein
MNYSRGGKMSKQEEKEDGNDGTGLKGWNMTEGMEQD